MYTRRLSNFAPRKRTRCVCIRNISTPSLPSLTYENPFWGFGAYQCLSVQCIYCQQIRAKNTSRQKQHLGECPGLRGHPNAQPPPQAAPNGIGHPNGYPGTPNGPTATPSGPAGPGTIATPIMTNGVNPHATPLQAPLQALQNRAAMATPVPATAGGPPSAPSSAAPSRQTPKPKSKNSTSSLPAPPLDDVHAAFVEFRAKEEDKVRGANICRILRTKLTNRISVCLYNVYIASKSVQRTQAASANICLSVPHISVL